MSAGMKISALVSCSGFGRALIVETTPAIMFLCEKVVVSVFLSLSMKFVGNVITAGAFKSISRETGGGVPGVSIILW